MIGIVGFWYTCALSVGVYSQQSRLESDLRVVNLAGESLDLFWINIFNEELLYQRPDEYRKVNPTSIQNGSEVTLNSLENHKLLVRLSLYPHIEVAFFKGAKDETYYVYYNKKYGLILHTTIKEDATYFPSSSVSSKVRGRELEDTVTKAKSEEYMQYVVNCFERKTGPPFLTSAEEMEVIYNPGDPLINVKNVIDSEDVSDIELLCQCVRDFMPSHIQDRPFGAGGGYGGSNNVTFIGGFIDRLLPDLKQRLMDSISTAVEMAGWRPDPAHLGVRCVEVLTYGPEKELLLHTDQNSIYTVVVMLSEPNKFEGGDFVIRRDSSVRLTRPDWQVATGAADLLRSAPQQGDAIIFDSSEDHGVQPIAWGKRTVLVIELWIYDHISPQHLRPTVEEFQSRQWQPQLIKRTPLLGRSRNQSTADAHSGVAGKAESNMVRSALDSIRSETQLLSFAESVFACSLLLNVVCILWCIVSVSRTHGDSLEALRPGRKAKIKALSLAKEE